MVFFYAQIEAFDPLTANEESCGRVLLPPGEARAVPWVQRNRALYEVALSAALLH